MYATAFWLHSCLSFFKFYVFIKVFLLVWSPTCEIIPTGDYGKLKLLSHCREVHIPHLGKDTLLVGLFHATKFWELGSGKKFIMLYCTLNGGRFICSGFQSTVTSFLPHFFPGSYILCISSECKNHYLIFFWGVGQMKKTETVVQIYQSPSSYSSWQSAKSAPNLIIQAQSELLNLRKLFIPHFMQKRYTWFLGGPGRVWFDPKTM